MHDLRPETAEDLEQPLARRDGDDTDGRGLLPVRRIGVVRVGHECPVLQLHVLDFDPGQRAVVDREFQRLTRSLRVHVYTHKCLVADGNHRLTERFHATFHVGERKVGIAQQELGTEAEGQLFFDRLDQRSAVRVRRGVLFDVSTRRPHPRAFEDHPVAFPA